MFLYDLGAAIEVPKCAKSVVLPAGYMSSTDANYLPGFASGTSSTEKTSWVPIVVGAAVAAGVVWWLVSNVGALPPIAANPGEEDETERMINEIRFGPLPQQLRNIRPVNGCKLTPPQRAVLQKIDGLRLPFLSKALVYANEIDRKLTIRERKTVLALLFGGAIRVYRERGPLPGDHPSSTIGAFSNSHYRIESVCR